LHKSENRGKKGGHLMSLKSELQSLNFEDRAEVEKVDLDLLIEAMLENIGSTDSELRDQLIYSTFVKLILEDYLNAKQMKTITEVCLEKIFMNIGERESDSVFTRSFSALALALVLYKDRQKPFLEKAMVDQAIEASLTYLKREEDTRGYVKEKGWAHSIAHGADLLDEAVRHPSFSLDRADVPLDTIKTCLFKTSLEESPYIDEEDERMITSVEALLEKGLPEETLINWTTELANEISECYQKGGFSLSFFRKKTTVAGFLKCMYFRLVFKKEGSKVRENIRQILEQWHKGLYE